MQNPSLSAQNGPFNGKLSTIYSKPVEKNKKTVGEGLDPPLQPRLWTMKLGRVKTLPYNEI